jgi:hypothetical protein
VFGLLERETGRVHAEMIPATHKGEIQHRVRKHVAEGSELHTNRMENFWSLLKRSIRGTYVSVEPFHLFRYLDEQAYRYNERKGLDGKPLSDFERFKLAASKIVGKQLSWDQVTGKSHGLETRLLVI